MKKWILLLWMLPALGWLGACKKEAASPEILINFINATGARIENAVADQVGLGTIENNGQTGFIRFEKFGTDTGMPDCAFTGKQNNDTLQSSSIFLWCGTEKAKLQPGKYSIEIKLATWGGKQYFDLWFK